MSLAEEAEARAHLAQPAHALDRKTTLRLHYSHLLVNAVSPEAVLLRRRASILRKAPLKNSTSSTLVASAACRRRFSSSIGRGLLLPLPSLAPLSKRLSGARQA